MRWLSSALIIIFITIAILLSVETIVDAVKLLIRGDPGCSHFFPRRDLALGILMLSLCLVGLISLIWQFRLMQTIYRTVLVVLTLLILVIIVFFIVGANNEVKDKKKADSRDVLERYSPWLQRFLLNEKDLSAFKNCMIQKDVCKNYREWSPFQEGCCYPPKYCGIDQSGKNLSHAIPKSRLLSQESDCLKWSNNLDNPCFTCDACKAAYIRDFDNNWIDMGIYLIVTFIFLLGCVELSAHDKKKRALEGIHV